MSEKDLLAVDQDDSEEEKKSDALDEITARIKALKIQRPEDPEQAASETSWQVIGDTGSESASAMG